MQPSNTKKFTDQNLKILYGNILNHYKNQAGHRPDITDVYNQMYYAVYEAVELPKGFFYDLPPQEKQKVYAAFDAIFRALPLYRSLSVTAQDSFDSLPPPNIQTVYVQRTYIHTYNPTLDWLFLSTLMNDCRYRAPPYIDGGYPNVHTHPTNISTDDSGQLITLLFLLALLTAAAALAILACYYMLNEFLNSVERICYDEGYLRALLMLSSTVAFGSTSALLTLIFGATPLVSLAIMAGLNPAGVVIAGTVFVTLIGAGLGAFIMNLIHDSIDKVVNKNALDPADPLRFRLTEDNEISLQKQGIDPIKVKCAMVALRAEISRILDVLDEDRKPIPSFLNRKLGDGGEVHELLQKVRKLRSGDIHRVEVGGLTFDCRASPNLSVLQASQSSQAPQGFQIGGLLI